MAKSVASMVRPTAVVLAVLLALPAIGLAETPHEYNRFVAEKAPVLVTLKFVLKIKAPAFGDQEAEAEATGIVIDPSGLILCSNTPMGGFVSAWSRSMPGGGDISATPTDIKVLIGDDTEGLEATLITVDSELDLAWLKIKEPGERKFAALDFSKAATPKLGDRLLVVRRMGKYFDRIPAVTEDRVGAIARKPRGLYVPSMGQFQSMIGLPVYNAAGQVVGMTVMQSMDDEDVDMNPMSSFSQMEDMQDLASGLVLPAADIVRATEAAKKMQEMEP